MVTGAGPGPPSKLSSSAEEIEDKLELILTSCTYSLIDLKLSRAYEWAGLRLEAWRGLVAQCEIESSQAESCLETC